MLSSVLLSLSPLALPALPARQAPEASPFRQALVTSERALEAGDVDKARTLLQRALERDKRSLDAWRLRRRIAAKAEDQDEEVYALHQILRLASAQGVAKDELAALRAELEALDPMAKDLLTLKDRFMARLSAMAAEYEEDGRPHSAIGVHKKILSLDPENVASLEAIQRIAATPDPSLAEEATPKDLFADVTREWIDGHDAEHGTWKERAKLERDNYITYTDAGYEVLVRAAEAMEQVNAFYRVFFRFGTQEDGGTVPRISLHIFRTRDEYLKLGIGPPVEWSGGHFTGTHVETYLPDGQGFEGMINTLFHEAAHQFVSLATNASGWLNEGLASFFEGTQILPNGTVIANMPADHRLFPLASRMENGWMTDHTDGITDSDSQPSKAPRFGTVLENKYEWGPPWYAPTWGVVYFLYNYQDPVDGRYVYRAAFQEFINKSGGRVGEGAIRNFEEVVLENPKPPYEIDAAAREGQPAVKLPRTVVELDPVWKAWCLRLRDERRGAVDVTRPYRAWGRYAGTNGDDVIAVEHFEKGLVESPDDVALLVDFADLLGSSKKVGNPDRAARLLLDALAILERVDEPDEAAIADAEKRLAKLDPSYATLSAIEDDLAANAKGIVQRYEAAGMPMMVMDLSWRMGNELGLTELFGNYERALRESGRSLDIWTLAYNEQDLSGWVSNAGETFSPKGSLLEANFGAYDENAFDFRQATLDVVTSGDFSIEAEVQAEKGFSNFAGFVFGQKDARTFHGYLLFPGRKARAAATADAAFVDLMSSFDTETKTWRHVPVEIAKDSGQSTVGSWQTMRLDVSGRFVDLWFNGELIASHEFPNTEILRGRFGLLTGPGTARFRDVRYLARDSRDPGAQIQRAVTVEALRSSGEPVGGSYQGLVPPWPEVARWVQDERSAWDDRGHVPQLLVLWSIQQNDLIPLEDWLVDLVASTREIGLEIVSVASANDADALAGYLADHPYPGTVGVDAREGTGIGDTFEAYSIERFNLPRLLLIDIDGTVFWEGDPGFQVGSGWDPGVGSYLDDPLAELVRARKLKELAAWERTWTEVAEPALEDGDIARALPVLKAAAEFDRRYSPAAGRAQSCLAALTTAIDGIQAAAASFQREEAAPALEVLLGWAPVLEREVDRKLLKELDDVRKSDAAEDWEKVPKDIERWEKKKQSPEERAAFLIERLGGYEGRFPRELRADLEEAAAAADWERFDGLVAGAGDRPLDWLVRDYFGWSRGTDGASTCTRGRRAPDAERPAARRRAYTRSVPAAVMVEPTSRLGAVVGETRRPTS